VAADADTILNPMPTGLMEPVLDELDVPDLEVEGELPEGLRGAYLRTGPNPEFEPMGKYHSFSADGMVHGVYFEDGTARYRNRFVESKGLLAERRAGRALYGSLEDFSIPDPELVGDAGMMKNTGNTQLVRHAGEIFALYEAGLPTHLSWELDTLGEWDFAGKLAGACTAHPKLDPVTGEMLFFGYSPFPPYVSFHTVDASGALVRTVAIDLPRSVMMHDFAVTAGHAVFFDLPAVFDVMGFMEGTGPMLAWRPEHGARIGVLPRDGDSSSIRWFEVPPFYVFHFLNAWESDDGTTLTVLGCRMHRMGLDLGGETGDPVVPTLHRWTIDLTAGTVTEEQLDDHGGDFPRVAQAHETRQNGVGYIATSRTGTLDAGFDGISRYDLATGDRQVRWIPEGHVCGEATFCADPSGTAEDDGWLVTFVMDRATRATDLWVLDARDITGAPLAKVKMPRRVPNGFHGNWFPA
jgi:carotenoid cleavage dioxygenase